ncbi:KR domain-containing protein [Aspergillus californicus]
MVSMGFLGFKDGIGIESTGIVRQVGKNVKLQPGDEVMVTGTGTMQTRICQPAYRCVKIPSGVSLQDAATMTVAFSTVIYSPRDLGGIQRGQSILIHSAAGGVGQAAIQICQYYGAEIYTTAGTQEKRRHLQDEYKIAADRIFNSRDDSFVADVIQATQGKGVEIVLNSLAGELLHASWKCVAVGGKMIELGKRDFLGHGMLSMDLFLENRAFFGVDLERIDTEQPENSPGTLTQDYLSLLEGGHIRPIRPVTVFKAASAGEALRYMQKGSARYLLAGGLGGLGQAVSRWMFEHGARHFIFLSPSAGKEEHREILHELEALGCQATAIAGSVHKAEDVQQAIAIATSETPLAGVMNLSLVLKDESYLKMTSKEWQTAVDPKATGTWNLHSALGQTALDFFVANYAAGNTFLDAFAQYRRDQGLPAAVLNIGCVEEIGRAAQDAQFMQKARQTSIRLVQESELTDALHVLVTEPLPRAQERRRVVESDVLAIGMSCTKPLADVVVQPFWTGIDASPRGYGNLERSVRSEQTESEDPLRALLVAVQDAPSALDAPETIRRISAGGDMTEAEVEDFVVDSLMAIEMRNWARRKLSVEISLAEITRAGTVKGLGTLFYEKMKAKYVLD